MQNIAEFTSSVAPSPERLRWQAVEGGKIDTAKDVTHISVAANYSRRSVQVPLQPKFQWSLVGDLSVNIVEKSRFPKKKTQFSD